MYFSIRIDRPQKERKTNGEQFLRFKLLDALRGIAAFWIVLHHTSEGGHIEELLQSLPQLISDIMFRHGDVGVPIFFVISGFVLAHSLSKDLVNFRYFGNFALRRSIRLDPPYWASIALLLSFTFLSNIVNGETFNAPSFARIVAHIFYLQDILGVEAINTTYWTLCIEIQFYLVFCLVIMFAQRSGLDLNLVLISTGIISLLWPLEIFHDNVYQGLFFPYWHVFLLGVFCYKSIQNTLPKSIFYAFLIAIGISGFLYSNYFSIASFFTALGIHEILRLKLSGIGEGKCLQFLGLISYSLYLTHDPITGATFFLFFKLFGSGVAQQFLGVIVNVCVCLVVAYLFWWAFEQWSVKLSKKIRLHNKAYKA